MRVARGSVGLIALPLALGLAEPALAQGAEAAPDMGHRMLLLVLQLSVIIISSRVVGLLVNRYLRFPRVLGELVAGIAIGPYALGGISLPLLGSPLFPLTGASVPVSPELYGVGMIASVILLFLAGLETDLATFLRYSVVGTAVGVGGVVASFVLGDLTAVLILPSVRSFFSPTALFLGTLATATSVGITARILSERRKMSSPEGVTIVAGAVLDDVLGIVLLAVVVGIASANRSGATLAWGRIALIALKAFGFWIAATALGILVAPRLARGLKWFRSMDAVAATSFGLALMVAGLSEMAGLAMIIGAYITGLSLSRTDMAHELHERLHGLYQFLVPIFFCVMGMMVNFAAMRGVVLFGLAYAAAAVAGKIIGCGLPALLLGFNARGALRIGAGMLPRGEVTLIVAGIGLSSGAIGPDMFGVGIMTLLVASIIAPPILVRSFRGGSGTRSELRARDVTELKQIQLELPSDQVAAFLCSRVLQAFRDEEFYVHRLDFNVPIYQIRKEDIAITLTQDGPRVLMSTDARNEPVMRLVVLEEILELKDLLTQIQAMKSPDSMGTDLASGLFGPS
jgi:Kef-type K+ transport system membrane component KefB